ncbi:MAG: SocA family protein [Acidobacteria bacterium]|nr:SocA family protein [Acidobacteriota bacterium]
MGIFVYSECRYFDQDEVFIMSSVATATEAPIALKPAPPVVDIPVIFKAKKAREVILYIVQRAPIADRLHICKIIYFADRYHLEKYARLICNDRYVAMKYGPVPDGIYDIIKNAESAEDSDFAVDDFAVSPLREADLTLLSESDRAALDWAIQQYGSLSVTSLSQASHDETWNKVTQRGALLHAPYFKRAIPIPLPEITNTLKDGELLTSYLLEQH